MAGRSPWRCRRARCRRSRGPWRSASARPLANCTSVAFDASASTGAGPLAYRWRFGDGAESDAPVIAHAFAEPGRYQAELDVLGAGDQVARGARVTRAGARAPGAGRGRRRPGDRRARRAGGLRRQPARRPATARSPGFHWTFADGAEAEGATATHAYERPGLYRAVLRVEDESGHPCDFGVATRDRHGELPARGRGRRGAHGGDRRDGDARRRRQLRRGRQRHRAPLGHGRRHPSRRRHRHPRLHRRPASTPRP